MSDAGLGHYKPAHEGHSKHEYEVFHVDFERVEIPFIIALWIFVSSLAKIGEYTTAEIHSKIHRRRNLVWLGKIKRISEHVERQKHLPWH